MQLDLELFIQLVIKNECLLLVKIIRKIQAVFLIFLVL